MEILGMKLRDELEEGVIPIDAVVLVKFLDSEGNMGVHLTTTETLTDFEAFGLLKIAASVQKQSILKNWEADDDGGE